jgi:K+-sensing histidine kinase KdpD
MITVERYDEREGNVLEKKIDWKQMFPFSVRDLLFTLFFLLMAFGVCSVLRMKDGGDGFASPVFVLAVLMVSRFTNGYLFGLVASVLGVICVNYVFTYPYFEIDFSIAGYPLSFLAFLMVSVITCALTSQAKQKEEEIDRANLAASYTRAIVCGVSKKVGQALKQTGHKTVVLAGGVAANSHLRRELEATCKRYGARLVTPPISLCGDNGAMVAAAGYFEYLEGRFADTSLNASANDDGN